MNYAIRPTLTFYSLQEEAVCATLQIFSLREQTIRFVLPAQFRPVRPPPAPRLSYPNSLHINLSM